MTFAGCSRVCRPALHRLFVSHYPPLNCVCAILFCHTSSSSSLLPFPFPIAHFFKPISSHFPSSPEAEDSDFDSDSFEPISNLCAPDLPVFLQLLSQAKSKFSTHDEALTFLRSSSAVKPTKGLLCSALWELRRDWESALLAFRWSGDCALESRGSWNLMIWVLGKQKRFDLAWSLLRRMHRKSILTCKALIIMMERYASANEASKAIKTFHAFEKFNIKVDSTVFYALLCALCKNKNIEEAEELLHSEQKFFPLETTGFNILLDVWCNISIDLIEAKRVWREMAKHCIVPDATSYAHMICCLSKHRNLYDSVRMYDEMKKRGWIPKLKVYNYLIYALAREGCMKEAHIIFNKIIEADLQPDLETYNCMIIPLCEAHKLDEAQEMMNAMISRGIHPSIDTYHAFIMLEDFDGMLNVIEQMIESDRRPNQTTFLLIFSKFFRVKRSEIVLKMWSEMRKMDVTPNAMLYITVIKGLAADGWVPKAMEFYEEMSGKGFPAEPELEQLFKSHLLNSKNYWGGGRKGFIARSHAKIGVNKGLNL